MIDKMLRAKDVAEIMGYKDLDRVRVIMRNMPHMEEPLRVPENALREYINSRMYMPSGEKRPPAEARIPRRRGGRTV